GDKETEFGDELFTVIRDEMEFIPIYRMDSALVELERMGRSGDAQALLEQLGKRHSERLAAYDDFSGKLRCQSLVSLVEEAKRKAAIDERPLREVIANALTERNGLLRPRDAARLAQFSEDDFFAYFSS